MNRNIGQPTMPKSTQSEISRRQFLAGSTAAVTGFSTISQPTANEEQNDPADDDNKALIAITYDLEMSAGYPVKGKLNGLPLITKKEISTRKLNNIQ